MKPLQFSRSQVGISMVEIMIALLIGAFLMGGLIQMFISTKKSYSMQDASSRLQENGRFAVEFLSLDTHDADFWGCLDDISTVANNAAGVPGLSGTDNNNDNSDAIIDGTDTLTLNGFRNTGAPVTADQTSPTDALTIAAGTGTNLTVNGWAIVSDCEKADVFQVLSNTGTSITHAAFSGGNTYGHL